MMKLCATCQVEKPLSEFYGNGYGFPNCRECTKARARAHYAATISKQHAYEKRRNRTGHRRAYLTAACQKHRAANPERYRARTAVSNALRDGRLTRCPCEVCGAKKVQAHHDDYLKPLQVRWFCQRHHDTAHGKAVAP